MSTKEIDYDLSLFRKERNLPSYIFWNLFNISSDSSGASKFLSQLFLGLPIEAFGDLISAWIGVFANEVPPKLVPSEEETNKEIAAVIRYFLVSNRTLLGALGTFNMLLINWGNSREKNYYNHSESPDAVRQWYEAILGKRQFDALLEMEGLALKCFHPEFHPNLSLSNDRLFMPETANLIRYFGISLFSFIAQVRNVEIEPLLDLAIEHRGNPDMHDTWIALFYLVESERFESQIVQRLKSEVAELGKESFCESALKTVSELIEPENA